MNSYWFFAASAGATLLLAIAAFWTIWQNYTLRKEDRELHFKLKTLDDIIDWARKTRETILNSLTEYVRYQKEVLSTLKAEEANLESQLKVRKSRERTTENKTELTKLEKELKILRGERLTKDDINFMVMGMLKEALTEYDFLKHTADQFGEGFQVSMQKTGDALNKLLESLTSEAYPHKSPISECGSALNQLALDAISIKSLLLRYGSKLKL